MTGQEKNRDFYNRKCIQLTEDSTTQTCQNRFAVTVGGLRVKDVITERNVKTANEKNERGRVDR